MTKQRDPKITIQEIILACENAIQFIEGMAFDQILIAGCMDLAIFTLYQIIPAIKAIRRQDIKVHQRAMVGSYLCVSSSE